MLDRIFETFFKTISEGAIKTTARSIGGNSWKNSGSLEMILKECVVAILKIFTNVTFLKIIFFFSVYEKWAWYFWNLT